MSEDKKDTPAKKKIHLSSDDKKLLAGKGASALDESVTVTGTPPGGNPGPIGSPSPPSGGSPPPPPPGCPPPQPDTNWAANSPSVMSALNTAGANLDGVQRAIDNWDIIAAAANSHGVDPALLAGIALRETNFQDISQPNGLGRGVFQIDLGQHPDVSEGQANDLSFSANYAANILAQDHSTLAAQHPNFTAAQLTQATAASYNFGTSNISGNPDTIDEGTTGNNYGSNVVNMMPSFKDPDTGLTPKAGSNNGGKDGC